MAFVIRVLGFGLAVGSLLFLSRFVGAAVNPHLAAYRGNYLGFVVIGFLGTEFQQVGVSVLAQRIRMAQVMGTLEAEVATPAPPWMVLGAPPVYEFATAALRSAAYLLGAKLLLGLDLSRANWLSLVVVGAAHHRGVLRARPAGRRDDHAGPPPQPGGDGDRLAVVLPLGRHVPGHRAAGLAARRRQPPAAHPRAGRPARRAAGRRRPRRAAVVAAGAARLRRPPRPHRAPACSPSPSAAPASTARFRTTEERTDY